MEIGQKVIVRATMNSYKKAYGRGRYTYRSELKEPLEGVFVGIRVMKEGWTDISNEDPPVFIPSGSKRVYLIAVAKNRTVKALPEDVEVKEGGDDL